MNTSERRVVERLLWAYERVTPSINQELVDAVLVILEGGN